MEKLSLPGTSGSDAHQVHEIGTFLTLFENGVKGEKDFLWEVRAASNSFSYLMIFRALSKAMDTPMRLSPAIKPDATGMV